MQSYNIGGVEIHTLKAKSNFRNGKIK
jgi:hypothetical protein